MSNLLPKYADQVRKWATPMLVILVSTICNVLPAGASDSAREPTSLLPECTAELPRVPVGMPASLQALVRTATVGDGQQVAGTPDIAVSSMEQLRQAMEDASPGHIIEIVPGSYRLEMPLKTGRAGTPSQPIVVRAARAGSVMIESAGEIAIKVNAPYWVFERLTVRGVCTEDSTCEHAFQVVGDGAHVILRDNRMEDFNAHLKVNGLQGRWPDDGILQGNVFWNSRPRHTRYPVAPIDIVAASDWQVLGNLVANFAKADGDGVAYGIFMKGSGAAGRIEKNVVICTVDHSMPGKAHGISFGGEGTGKRFCRDQICHHEFADGLLADNVIAHCSGYGVDDNRSIGSRIVRNTVIDTAGIVLRGRNAGAEIVDNLMEGEICGRNGGVASLRSNVRADERDALPRNGDLTCAFSPQVGLSGGAQTISDYLDRIRYGYTPDGATENARRCSWAVLNQ